MEKKKNSNIGLKITSSIGIEGGEEEKETLNFFPNLTHHKFANAVSILKGKP